MQDRKETLTKLENYQSRIVCTTSLLERGIDLPRCNLVLNYDMPDSFESYVNRAGRAGRFGTKGLVVSLVTPADAWFLEEVQRKLCVVIPVASTENLSIPQS